MKPTSTPNIELVTCETAINKLKRKIPYGWDLNIYRGCQHGCQYCFAQYSHKYLEKKDFYNDIVVKTNIVEKLEEQLRSPQWKREIVNIGGVTDSYQPIEEEFRFMPDILKLLIKYRTPAIISTKSDLILRDYDLIDQLSQITYINVAATITTVNESVREKLEPGGVSSARRFAMLKEFRKTNASIGVHVMPIIPYLTDSRENMEALCSNAKDCGADYFLPGTLYLRGNTKGNFLKFINEQYPDLYESLAELYKKGGAGKEYKSGLYEMVNELRNRYGLSSSYTKPIKEKLKKTEQQLSLF
ncbi:radical SAM protein [Bacteroides sp. 224]|uniref:SPL family radical SAM protein n=1 Tax=Bacteroides sp. 224 TaxID=2302936 RepID=UPI0013D1D718|nr:radical SAM protein [Bacteroides sp. 224]NDV66595.1 radical SAM protein [Bacteroides sp. 224]